MASYLLPTTGSPAWNEKHYPEGMAELLLSEGISGEGGGAAPGIGRTHPRGASLRSSQGSI